ncbi:dienelactone hydrolase family protein [Aeromicrobium sp. NPDC092404]|uniref:alpha/beta hydrolase family protein n=1 Tax=Aeromicrobium sp. NPDC092404 TaxID=3154976 RepID=UPI003425E900
MRCRPPSLLLITALLMLPLAGCGGDSGGADDARPRSSSTPTGNPAGKALAHQVPGMSKIVATTETYAKPDGAALEMDLYTPSGGGRAPVVLLLHGVTPDASPKEFGGFVGWGQALASSGVAAAVVNYRAEESGAGPGADDVEAAIAHLRDHDRIDMSRWGLLAFSAGGPYGVRAAAADPAGLAAAGFFYARTEPSSGAGTDGTSLSTLVTKRRDLPVFAAFGAKDPVPGIAESQRRLQDVVGRDGDGRVLVRVHPTAGHAFDIDDDEDSGEIVRSGVAFFVEHLLP